MKKMVYLFLQKFITSKRDIAVRTTADIVLTDINRLTNMKHVILKFLTTMTISNKPDGKHPDSAY